MIANLQRKAKIGNGRPSDEVEGLKFEVRWEPAKGALGAVISPEESTLPEGVFVVSAACASFICSHARLNLTEGCEQFGLRVYAA